MNRIRLILAGAFFVVAPGVAQAQDNTISSGPFRFGLSAAPAGSAFDNSAARYEKDNPVNRRPWDGQANAAPSGNGPSLGPEGSGTPMSRGGVNDTLTGGANARAVITAPGTPVATPKAGKANKAADAKPQGAKTKDAAKP